MITPEYARVMARYNTWQNNSLYREASQIGEDARRLERGAFFGSIHDTLVHILWGDHIWMHRFDGWDMPKQGISDSAQFAPAWDGLQQFRKQTDERITDWADGVGQDDLSGDLTWFSGAINREIMRPRAMCITHLFNHQTHHRGQVHAMLTAAGAKPDDTDLPFIDTP